MDSNLPVRRHGLPSFRLVTDKTPKVDRRVIRRHNGGEHHRELLKVRASDPHTFSFKVGMFIQRRPVLVASLVALAIASIPVIMLLRQQDELQQARVGTSQASCSALNQIGLSTNGLNLYLQNLLKISLEANKDLKIEGAPPYEVRAKQVDDQVKILRGIAVPEFDCKKYGEFVQENSVPQQPGDPTPKLPVLPPKFPSIDPTPTPTP